MLREILKPESQNCHVHIPREYVHQEIEVIILPLFELKGPESKVVANKSFNPREYYGLTSESKEVIDLYLSGSKKEWGRI